MKMMFYCVYCKTNKLVERQSNRVTCGDKGCISNRVKKLWRLQKETEKKKKMVKIESNLTNVEKIRRGWVLGYSPKVALYPPIKG